ncbi:two-component sensor histidine kinase [Streptomyces agglomeratus]|uniref:sensor histidine kinase n=1 Tax=Streptomyces agglomeratus TaxID=285458 RepID=UPI00086E4CA7|nr:HAMP domain-containing sensor histidine kinase [Streptomyces agglomeratus]OEJ58855.1 two-component sensor histidine kinase [Streptomyces agglomeratus]
MISGLRTRLVLAFLLVAAVGCGTTAALTYREARNALLEQAQDTAVSSFRDQVEGFHLNLPPNTEQMQGMARSLARQGKPRNWWVYVEYGSVRLSSGTNPTSTVITPELRRRARGTPHGSFQRVVKNGEPYLTMAMPVVFKTAQTGTGGQTRRPAGLTFYAVMRLTDEQVNVDAMVVAARDGALPALAVALVPALLAARSVLRPVRDLRQAARSLGRGRLDTRIPVKGGGELSELARTFNESTAALERSVDELQRAEARARRFASDVSHELRTPLAGMLAVTELLDEDAAGLDPDTAAAVRLISSETDKLAVLVEDLMEISRFDARAAELNTDEVDAAETIRRTLQSRHWTDPERIVLDLPDGIRARLDPRRFDVVVANLVGNALRHGRPPVTVALRTETRPPGPAEAAEGPADGTPDVPGGGVTHWLVTEVADRGPGIPADVLPHVFDRFYKADQARTRSEGSGLGLAITLENVRLHGGTVRAANGPDGGAVFVVEIPLTTSEVTA